eukprot:scaffold58866_cov30-Tisochrysis_lutea.AAC.1
MVLVIPHITGKARETLMLRIIEGVAPRLVSLASPKIVDGQCNFIQECLLVRIHRQVELLCTCARGRRTRFEGARMVPIIDNEYARPFVGRRPFALRDDCGRARHEFQKVLNGFAV